MAVDVIMTVYNAGDYLSRAIDSVLAQTYHDWRLSILDDNSSDKKVGEVIAEVLKYEDPRLSYQHYDTSEKERTRCCRYAALINDGLNKTENPLITYLCGDDYYLPDRLERMVAKMRSGCDVVYGAQRLYKEGKETPFATRPALAVLKDAWQQVDLNSVMHTREALDHVRKVFDPEKPWPTEAGIWRNADAYFWRRLTDCGYVFVPVEGGPTDCKVYRENSVDARVVRGESPW